MKKIILILLLLPMFASAQKLQHPVTFGYEFDRVRGTMWQGIPNDTITITGGYRDSAWIAKKGTTIYLWNTSTYKWDASAGGGSGTVTTVSGLSPLFTVANATTTPTFSLISQSQNLVYASPNGSSGVPSFRALVAGDLPSITVPLSSVTGLLANTAINNQGFGEEWRWPTISGTKNAFALQTSSTASGDFNLLNLALEGEVDGQTQTTRALNIGNQRRGNQFTNIGIDIDVDQASVSNIGIQCVAQSDNGTTTNIGGDFNAGQFGGVSTNTAIKATAVGDAASTNTAVRATASGEVGSINTAGYFSATGGTTNYAIIVPASSGFVGIGTSTPSTTLHVSGASGFRYVDGNQASGAVLVSDANGVGAWSTTPTGFTIPINKLAAATGTNNIDNTDYAQTLQWSTLSGSGLRLLSTSTAAAGGNQILLEAGYSSGANANASQTTYAAKFYNQHTGTSSTNVAAWFNATGGTNNYAILVPNGSVGIGTSTPTEKLEVVGNAKVSGTGNYFYGRWRARVDSTTSSATPTINTDNVDIYKITALTTAITSFTTNLSGSPVDGDILEIQVTGTAARAISWGTSFVSSTVTLPTTTVTTATLTVILQYFTTYSYGNNKWVCVNSF